MKASQRVLVCGGRHYNDRAAVFKALDAENAREPIGRIISGGATGADALGEAWAREKELPFVVFPAEWKKYGRAAGPLRNLRMLDAGKPTLVMAFPGGDGTMNMISLAQQRGIPVLRLPAATSPP